MKRYDSYKDSGVEWIGEVPSHWEVTKLNNICGIITDYVASGSFAEIRNNVSYLSEPDYAMLIRTADLSNKNTSTNKVYINKHSYNFLKNSNLFGGEVILPNIGSVGDVYIMPENLYEHMSLAPNSIMLKTKYSNKYFYYYFFSKPGKDSLILLGASSVQAKFNKTELRALKTIVPSINEQEHIVSYLDSKCGEIDKVISTQEKRIALLQELKQSIITHAVTKGLNPDVKMKDSGIEWIGEVPEHWEICKIKHIGKIHGRVGYRGYTTADLVQEGEGALTIGGKHISKCTLDLSDAEYISWSKYYESPEIMVTKGDILIAQRGSLGKSALIKEDIGEATINPSLVLLNSIKFNPTFLHYILLSDSVITTICLLNTSTAVPMITQNQIANIMIPKCHLTEQQEIASYLDKRCAQIDASISKAQREIELLQEYKQSLITEVVTGKRKVC